jgi:pimeloyl-ACP methyl ester carboxylesterase
MFYANLVDGLDFRQVSPVNSISHTATPILLIHGLADSRTPPSQSQKLAAANPRDTLWLVPNANHTGALAAAPDEFRRRVLSWFARF